MTKEKTEYRDKFLAFLQALEVRDAEKVVDLPIDHIKSLGKLMKTRGKEIRTERDALKQRLDQ